MSRVLRVGGMVPLTTLDYPGQLACVLFCQGCAWRCRYCHNPQLIPPRGSEEVDWCRVLAFLQRRQDLLDAVVFSGGEPTLQDGLAPAMEEVRQMGFRIGLHKKDLSLALAGARTLGVALPQTAGAAQLMQACADNGMAELDHSALVRALELMAHHVVAE